MKKTKSIFNGAVKNKLLGVFISLLVVVCTLQASIYGAPLKFYDDVNALIYDVNDGEYSLYLALRVENREVYCIKADNYEPPAFMLITVVNDKGNDKYYLDNHSVKFGIGNSKQREVSVTYNVGAEKVDFHIKQIHSDYAVTCKENE